MPQHGTLEQFTEPSILATIDQLIRERKLVKRGRKYPTITVPSARAPAKPRVPRTPKRFAPSRGTRVHGIKLELDTYRKQKARQLKWKAYMVFQRSTIVAIDARRPRSHAELAQIPGLGPAKIARFGDDILAVVRRHTASE